MVVVYVVLVFVLNMHVVALVVGVVDVGEVLMVRSVTNVGSLGTVVVNVAAIHQVVSVVATAVVVVIGLVIVGVAMVEDADQGHVRMTVKEDEDLEVDPEADPETDLAVIRTVVDPAHVLALFRNLETIVLSREIEDLEVGRTSQGRSPSQDLSRDQDLDLRTRMAKMMVGSTATATISCFSCWIIISEAVLVMVMGDVITLNVNNCERR